jgi:hypothetical protein
MHEEILKCALVDHRNRNGLDNQRHNLRVATHTQNRVNSGPRSDNRSGFKGVSFCKARNKWQAGLNSKRKYKFLGYFVSPEEAARAYDAAAKSLWGEFAFLNFS